MPVSESSYAIYSNLPPGKYSFEVKASNNDGIWNKEPASFDFEIIPPFWQTWWFYVSCAGAMIFSIYLLVKIRIKHLERQQNVLKEKVEQINLELEHRVRERTVELAKINKSLQTEIAERKMVEEALRESEEKFRVDLNSVPIQWEGRPAALNFFMDITDKKRLEEQLMQAQKMEAIDTTAGGIAHDFNNLLMGILGNASLILSEISAKHPFHTEIKNIEQYAQNGAHLTRQLLGFARGGKYEVIPTDLNRLIKKTTEMFSHTRKEIRIYDKYEANIRTINVDQGQIEQVLMNIYVNAWQAMPGAGDIYVQTENITLDENDAQSYGLKLGNYVKISITDTGIGMYEITRQRIFEPFFTTKELARGTETVLPVDDEEMISDIGKRLCKDWDTMSWRPVVEKRQ